MNTIKNNSITIGEYFKSYLEKKQFNIDFLLDYIDTYDITNLYNKEEFLMLYYKIIPENNNKNLTKKIKKDFNVISDISPHFLSRLLMRFKDNNAVVLFNKINKLINSGYYKQITSNNTKFMRLKDNDIIVIYKGSTNVVISIFKNKREESENICSL